ncbi:hypothetical protein KJR58_24200 [Escherichia coli]|uniref:hypothetical protein n=1 Tax=Escherichia coli TaxID=562 RepID=UPI0020055F40|nr:hypothetical protein [Escherichia coli]MCK4212228.1 hypothetical protein [Escherichia coli]
MVFVELVFVFFFFKVLGHTQIHTGLFVGSDRCGEETGKKPLYEDYRQITGSIGNMGQKEMGFDFSGPLDEEKTIAYRRSLIHNPDPTRLGRTPFAASGLKKKNTYNGNNNTRYQHQHKTTKK